MLNREEYNMTFGHNLTQEEFDKILPLRIDSENIKNMERLCFVNKETHEVVIFRQVVHCKDCKHGFYIEGIKYCDGAFRANDWFCADGEPKEGADADN